jgi:hypothetical protein
VRERVEGLAAGPLPAFDAAAHDIERREEGDSALVLRFEVEALVVPVVFFNGLEVLQDRSGGAASAM